MVISVVPRGSGVVRTDIRGFELVVVILLLIVIHVLMRSAWWLMRRVVLVTRTIALNMGRSRSWLRGGGGRYRHRIADGGANLCLWVVANTVPLHFQVMQRFYRQSGGTVLASDLKLLQCDVKSLHCLLHFCGCCCSLIAVSNTPMVPAG
jgi:hypothetical protein